MQAFAKIVVSLTVYNNEFCKPYLSAVQNTSFCRAFHMSPNLAGTRKIVFATGSRMLSLFYPYSPSSALVEFKNKRNFSLVSRRAVHSSEWSIVRFEKSQPFLVFVVSLLWPSFAKRGVRSNIKVM